MNLRSCASVTASVSPAPRSAVARACARSKSNPSKREVESIMSSKAISALELPPLTDRSSGERAAPLGERLDLVGHVKVKLTITLGGAELTLGQLFSMTAGETVALDRAVDDPIDIRLHEKLIARGQLVAVG